MAKTKYVSTRGLGSRNSAGIGYVVIPQDEDRFKFIDTCFRTNTVALQLENGGVSEAVSVSKHVFDHLEFPKTYTEKGSLCMWVNIPKKNQIVVVGIINKDDEFISFSESGYVVSRETQKTVAKISMNAKSASLNVSVTSSEDNIGEININAKNATENAKINVYSNGSVNVSADGLVNVSSFNKISFNLVDEEDSSEITFEKGVGLKYKDQYENEIQILEDKILIKNKEGIIQEFTDKEVSFNGGENGGLAIVGSLVTKLNNIETKVNTILSTLKSVSITLAPTGVFPFAPIFGSITPLDSTSEKDIENKKVKH